MITKGLVLLAVVAAASAGHQHGGGVSRQSRRQDGHGYQFSYDIQNPHGAQNGRWEEGDKWGNKRGSYYIHDADGRQRKVNYIADGHGFRAHIDTNEPGTKTSLPAAAAYNSDRSYDVHDRGYDHDDHSIIDRHGYGFPFDGGYGLSGYY